MFVRYRKWYDGNPSASKYSNAYYGDWRTGKIHWMAEPWITICGMIVEDAWLLNVSYRHPAPDQASEGCKRCGL